MMKNSFIYVVFIMSSVYAKEKVLLSEVETLSFSKGEMTTGRRSLPIKQMNCLNGDCSNGPHSVACKNIGTDGKDPTWECVGSASTKISYVKVQCEGYDYPDDPYILVGSCGLDYRVSSTNRSEPSFKKQNEDEPVLPGFLLSLIIIVGLSACCSNNDNYDTRPGFWTGAAVGAAFLSSNESSWKSDNNDKWESSIAFGSTGRR